MPYTALHNEGGKFAQNVRTHTRTNRRTGKTYTAARLLALLFATAPDAQQLREAAAEDMVGLFILPPSIPELERRLRGRHTDDEQKICERLAQARRECALAYTYDYIVINDDLEHACRDVLSIMETQRLCCPKQLPFIDDLLK